MAKQNLGRNTSDEHVYYNCTAGDRILWKISNGKLITVTGVGHNLARESGDKHLLHYLP